MQSVLLSINMAHYQFSSSYKHAIGLQSWKIMNNLYQYQIFIQRKDLTATMLIQLGIIMQIVDLF